MTVTSTALSRDDGGFSLIRSASNGDEDAMAEVVRLYGPLVQSVIARYVPAGRVEDLVQETFFALWRIGGRLHSKNGSRLGTYIFSVARNKAIDALRVRGHTMEVQFLSLDDVIAEASRFLEDVRASSAFLRLEMTEELVDALKMLSPAQRTVIALQYLRGLTPAEIATYLGRTPSAVKALAHVGRRRLEVFLRDARQVTEAV